MTPALVSPTAFALEAMGGRPVGAPARLRTRCACCGQGIEPGEPSTPTGFGPSFNDGASLAARSGVLCGSCPPFLTGPGLRATQKVVITRDGAFPLAKDVHRAWFFLTPPEPPYVALVSDSMLQHLIWRTPLTLSNDLQIVRLGPKLLRIRRRVLIEALDWAREAIEAIAPSRPEAAEAKTVRTKSKPAKPPARHPFVSLDREMGSPTHGLLRADVARDPRATPWIERLRTLTSGELWALATLAKREAPVPEKPDLLPSLSLA